MRPAALNRFELRAFGACKRFGSIRASLAACRLETLAGHDQMNDAAVSPHPHGAGLEMLGPGDLWYKDAIIYSLSVDAFQDSNEDGIGDFPGLTSRLDYLDALGVTCIWLQPFYPSPRRDHGYDVVDYYGVHPSLGTLGDFVDFLRVARGRGIRVIVDLVVNHTSDQHPWFVEARRDRQSRYRDYYVWAEEPPAGADAGMVFPGIETSTWTRDEVSGSYYFHRFYRHQPDLNLANPAVREEVRKIMGFWLELGVSGFRVDAAPFLIERKGSSAAHDARKPHTFFRYMRNLLSWRRGDAALLAEANVPMEEIADYVGSGDKLHLLFNFHLNRHLFLAVATERASVFTEALHELPRLPDTSQWANFLRNHDEMDLSGLTLQEREATYRVLAPDPSMQLYGRGIRRRLAPMLAGDRRRLEMVHSLMMSQVGTPVLYYGDEIGMGDELSLAEREAVRTPMQWNAEVNGGFSRVPAAQMSRPLVSRGPFDTTTINVAAQQRDQGSLLHWMRRIIGLRKTIPELSWGYAEVVESGYDSVVATRAVGRTSVLLALQNLAREPIVIRPLRELLGFETAGCTELLADDESGPLGSADASVALSGHGYRWIRAPRP
jgi:maltose alpha-D-glucosyltransferase/alpha-amylase